MEKRDTLEGETVKREKGAAGLGFGGLGTERGGGESDSSEDVASGCSGKSSSHSYPTPERSGKPKQNRYLVTEQSDILRSSAGCTLLSSRTSLCFTAFFGPFHRSPRTKLSSETKKFHFGPRRSNKH